jgi:hypothetical protein
MSESHTIDGFDYTLYKMTTDDFATVLYFDRTIDTSVYRVTLRDGAGTLYPLLPAFYKDVPARTENALRFSPLNPGIASFVVTVQNRETLEAFNYTLRIDGGLRRVPVSYLAEPVEFLGGGLVIDDVIISTDSTVITFSFRQGGDLNLYPLLAEKIKLSAKEGPRSLQSVYDQTFIYDFGDIILGKKKVNPVDTVAGMLNLTFDELFTFVKVEDEIAAQNMFERGHPERAVRLRHEQPDLEIVLEGIVSGGTRLVMPAHVVDLSDPAGRRLEADFDADMVLLTEDGEEFIINGVCHYGRAGGTYGADIIFEMPEDLPEEFRETSFDRISDRVSLRINSVRIKLPPIHVSISITDQMASSRADDIESVRFALEQAVSRRLDFRAGHIGLTAMRMYFDEAVLTSPMFQSVYRTSPNPANVTPMQAANVMAMAVCGDWVYAATAEYVDVMEYPIFMNRQMIIAERQLRMYRIVENALIEE